LASQEYEWTVVLSMKLKRTRICSAPPKPTSQTARAWKDHPAGTTSQAISGPIAVTPAAGGAVPKIRRRAVEKHAESNWIRTRDSHPAIVSRDLYEQARAKRLLRGNTATGGYRHGRGAKSDIEQKIYNIIDNITPTTREFAEKRIEQLKTELDGIERQIERVGAQAANAVDLAALEQALLDYMKQFGKVAAEGTREADVPSGVYPKG
jgi:hypothetical protein